MGVREIGLVALFVKRTSWWILSREFAIGMKGLTHKVADKCVPRHHTTTAVFQGYIVRKEEGKNMNPDA